MATQNTKKKSSSLQKNIKTKVFYLTMVTGFSLFGLYIAYDTYTDPETRGISAAVLVVSLIIAILITNNKKNKKETTVVQK